MDARDSGYIAPGLRVIDIVRGPGGGVGSFSLS